MKKSLIIGIFSFWIVVVLVGSFYWFEYRPNDIRKECADKTYEHIEKTKEDIYDDTLVGATQSYKFLYELCVHRKGIDR